MRSVSVTDLKPGMILARTIVNDDLIVVLAENTELTPSHIKRLTTLDVPFIYIKDEYELSSNFLSVAALFNPADAFVSEYKEVVNTAKGLIDTLTKGGDEQSVYETKCLVHENLYPLAHDSGVIDHIFEINHLASDVYNHSLRVAILSGVIGKWMEFKPAEVQDIILAGFLHDIGKSKLPPELGTMRGSAVPEEQLDEYMSHTMEASKILRACPNLPAGVVETAMQHHECMDGSGYPLGLTGERIHRYARIVALADFYDNLTTEVEGERRITPFAAIEEIAKLMYSKLDPNVCIPFITKIKLAFLGSRVLLSNGMIGTVVRYANGIDAQPLIRINEATIIDLNEYRNLSVIEYNPK